MNTHRPIVVHSRREWLQQSCCGVPFLGLASLLADVAARADTAPHFEPKAKRLIFLFMHGGVSAMDTFDPKPRLTELNGQPLPFEKPKVQFAPTGNLLKSPWEFKQHGQSGLWISELFPQLSQHADDLAVIRSMHCDNSAHGGAVLQLHTGHDIQVRPSMGAWLLYGLGNANRNLPGFLTMCPTLTHGGGSNWGSAFLPAAMQGVNIGNSSIQVKDSRIRDIQNAATQGASQRQQLDLVQQMNRRHQQRSGPDPRLEGRIESFELAFRMQTAAPDLMDLAQESKATLDLYGVGAPATDDFGRQCLMARRFVERGVRIVQCTHSSGAAHWDQHGNLKKDHERNASEVDRPISALIDDLKRRGLWNDTLILFGTEFGRTPCAQGTGDGIGRDHNPHGYTMWLAGGGVKGGTAYGNTDEFGYYAVEDKCHIHDLHATILHLMGIDHEKLLYRYAGRDFRLTDVSGNVVKAVLA